MYIGYVFGVIFLLLCVLTLLCDSSENTNNFLAGIGWLCCLGIGCGLITMTYLDNMSTNDIKIQYGEISVVTQYDKETVINVNGIQFESKFNLEVGDVVKVEYIVKNKSDIWVSGNTVYKPNMIIELVEK